MHNIYTYICSRKRRLEWDILEIVWNNSLIVAWLKFINKCRVRYLIHYFFLDLDKSDLFLCFSNVTFHYVYSIDFFFLGIIVLVSYLSYIFKIASSRTCRYNLHWHLTSIKDTWPETRSPTEVCIGPALGVPGSSLDLTWAELSSTYRTRYGLFLICLCACLGSGRFPFVLFNALCLTAWPSLFSQHQNVLISVIRNSMN